MKQSSVFIVAEMSANHNGSKKKAIETIKAAKRAGADAIKLQTYTADCLFVCLFLRRSLALSPRL